MDNQLEVGIYARVSTKGKRQETENQLLQLREYCRKMGWSIHKEYIDQESGDKIGRNEYKNLFRDAHRRKIDIVLCWALDRFSREGAIGTMKALQELDGYGVSFKSYTEPYIDTLGVWRDAVIAWIATIAKQEKIRIRERVIAGLERANKQGRYGGRPKAESKHKGLQEMACQLKLQGMSNRQIAARCQVDHKTVAKYLSCEMIIDG